MNEKIIQSCSDVLYAIVEFKIIYHKQIICLCAPSTRVNSYQPWLLWYLKHMHIVIFALQCGALGLSIHLNDHCITMNNKSCTQHFWQRIAKHMRCPVMFHVVLCSSARARDGALVCHSKWMALLYTNTNKRCYCVLLHLGGVIRP